MEEENRGYIMDEEEIRGYEGSRLKEKLQKLNKKIEKTRAKKEKVVSKKEKAVSEKEKAVSEEEKAVLAEEKLVSQEEKLVSEEGKLVSEEGKLVSKEEKLMAKKKKLTVKLEKLSKGKEALRDPIARKRKRVESRRGRYIGFILNDLGNEKKKIEELKVSEHLRSDLPVNDWNRERTVRKLKRSEAKVKELELEYRNLAFPEEIAEVGEDAQLRND